MKRALRLLAIAAALLAGGCPPPPDVDMPVAHVRRPAPVDPQTTTPATTDPSAPAQPPSDTVPVSASEDPMPVLVTGAPRPDVHIRLAGGTFVVRCPACGAVQPEKSTKCPACSQVLRPWRQEQLCSLCLGAGRCERCGDDRACLDCDGQGACPFCDGTGKLGTDKCFECNGLGKCTACAGDGRREATNHDFPPYETPLPGVCPTCFDGSGLCPDCGTLTKDRSGANCLTCGGSGICFDCGGRDVEGECPHCAGDGTCIVCDGAGREVVDGDPPKASDRPSLLRTAAGVMFTARVLQLPDPNVHVQQAGTNAPSALMRSQVSPLTYWLAARQWTPLDDAKGRLNLGTLAQASGFWPLAQKEFHRAMSIEPSVSSEATAQLREIADRRTQSWIETAEKAKKAGDRDGAAFVLEMVRFAARGSPLATRAGVILLQLDRERAEEEGNLDQNAKDRIEAERKGDAERAAAGARLRLDRARKLLAEAAHLTAADPAIEMLLSRADESAWSAQRLVQRTAFRHPAALVPWPVKPEILLKETRKARAEIAVFHAAREVAGARFDFGARLARRAIFLDPTDSQAPLIESEAKLGLVRRGVLQGSPAPKPPK